MKWDGVPHLQSEQTSKCLLRGKEIQEKLACLCFLLIKFIYLLIAAADDDDDDNATVIRTQLLQPFSTD